MTQPTLEDARGVLSKIRETLLVQSWAYIGLELKQAVEDVPAGDEFDDDREAAITTLNSWKAHPEGWRCYPEHEEDPALDNLVQQLDGLVRG